MINHVAVVVGAERSEVRAKRNRMFLVQKIIDKRKNECGL